MSKIITFQWNSKDFDVNTMPYKYAISEHPPIKLSDGTWLHSYKVTKYNDSEPAGDPDVEQEVFDNEMNG
jgi:hypothetical protein